MGDKASLSRFIRNAYGPLAPYKDESHWAWQFWDNPYRRDEGDLLPVSIALDGSEIVGQIAVQPAEFQLGTTTVAGGWIVDVFILAAYRGQGIGHKLHQVLMECYPLLLTLTMAPATRRIAEAASAYSLNTCVRYAKVLRTDPQDVRDYVLTRLQHRAPLQKFSRLAMRVTKAEYLIAPAVTLLAASRRSSRRASHRSELEMQEVSCFGDEIDRLWRDCASDFEAIAPRDRRFLAWRFEKSPHLKYRFVIARKGQQCRGYCVLRKAESAELRTGIIVDIFSAPGDDETISSLLGHAEDLLCGEVASLECAASEPDIGRLLRRAGYFAIGSASPTAVCGDTAWRPLLEEHRLNWHFTKADHDWDQVHLAIR